MERLSFPTILRKSMQKKARVLNYFYLLKLVCFLYVFVISPPVSDSLRKRT